MEITKEFLHGQVVGMSRELAALLEQVSLVQGCINTCKMLMERLEAPEPEPPKRSELLEARFDGADVEGLAEGRAMVEQKGPSVP